MNIRCINCGYFLNCSKADENITECTDGVKAKSNIEKGIDKNVWKSKQ